MSLDRQKNDDGVKGLMRLKLQWDYDRAKVFLIKTAAIVPKISLRAIYSSFAHMNPIQQHDKLRAA